MIFQAKHNLTSVSVVLIHKHGAFEEKFSQYQERAMNPVYIAGLQTLQRLFVYARKPLLFDANVSGGDYFEAFAYGLGGGLSNKDFGVSEGDPDQLEYLWHESIQQSRRSFG
jgi:hypothetical protein